MYPNTGVTLHRVTTMTVQRSQGDGEEQTTSPPPPLLPSISTTTTPPSVSTTTTPPISTTAPPPYIFTTASPHSISTTNIPTPPLSISIITTPPATSTTIKTAPPSVSITALPSVSTTTAPPVSTTNTGAHLPHPHTPVPPSKTGWMDMADGAESVSSVQEIPRHALTSPLLTEKRRRNHDGDITSPSPPPPHHHSPLPKVLDIAYKLTKVSVTTTPDSNLLNVPPKDLSSKNIIPLYPYKNRSSFSDKKFSTSRPKRKEPKFVPYEPYKACVKPIIITKNKKIQKCPKEKKKGKTDRLIRECKEMDNDGDNMKNAEKVSIMVKDFEKERAEWEQKTAKLKAEMTVLENQVTHMKKEKTNLESQLSVQSQINTELKKLLVASVGEDVQGRVQCLTEDKARMATMIRKYSERVDRDYEEKERIGIQCDVWRSKFLGSSMLVDELVGLRVGLAQQLKEASEGLKLLLDEHQLARQHVLNMYRMNKQLREAFDPLASASNPPPPLASADLVTLAVDGSGLAETVRDRLLGDLGRAVGDGGTHTHGLEIYTPGCKIARQLLGQIMSSGGGKRCECSTVSPSRAALVHRYHPNTRIDHLTVNCCAHCNGEIIVV
ncbi:hypothetical protein Pcinc_000497 [Petrolisthes cinctipes]|uniref:Golgin-45 n=1 Tax=Petrolisthes cinctipes TaxID=88211 RepID=A0AAE1GMT7_PETCI|nr:hypothetical protein Pcinc_000497 [Petrolisthes cinctipes]